MNINLYNAKGICQLIIARKDQHMFPGKLAVQVSYVSMAFLAEMFRSGGADEEVSIDSGEVLAYHIYVTMQPEIYNG